MTWQARLTAAFPELDDFARRTSCRFPLHARDECYSALLVVMVEAAPRWRNDGGLGFVNYVKGHLWWGASDWCRTQEGYSRRLKEKVAILPLDMDAKLNAMDAARVDRAMVDPGISPHRAAEIREVLEAVALLPERERRALLAEKLQHVAAEEGVTEARICQLRAKAKDRLFGLGICA